DRTTARHRGRLPRPGRPRRLLPGAAGDAAGPGRGRLGGDRRRPRPSRRRLPAGRPPPAPHLARGRPAAAPAFRRPGRGPRRGRGGRPGAGRHPAGRGRGDVPGVRRPGRPPVLPGHHPGRGL
ncbi:MAG: hypothetical protein AVDCRST_MAG48-1896, partial [uncultured Friedmanniella sp.]